MTPNKEDYLKTIYQLGGQDGLVNNKTLSEHLSIAPASVTEMLNKMAKQGLVETIPYKGCRLTVLGLQSCIDLVRSHRLWEVFLIRHLGYSWSEAHEDAHLLEHSTPERLLERLNRFLNYPQYCPHGEQIPQSDGEHPISLKTLNTLEVGDRAVIRKITEKKEILDYLQQIGLAIGKPITVTAKGALEGSIGFSQEDKNLEVTHLAAESIFVELEDEDIQKSHFLL